MPGRPQRRLPLSARMKDGRIYQQSRTSHTGIIYLRCQKSTICQGTAKIVNGAIEDLNPHSIYCLPDYQVESNDRFKQALRDALSRHWYKLRDLYDSLAAVHPEAALNISFRSIRSYMKTWRKKLYPPHPQSISEFANRLMDPRFERNLEYDTGRLSVKLITDSSGADHALLFDQNFVETEMHDVSRLLIDGTFRSTPSIEDAYQLLTIMGIKFNHGFPFIWVVMSRKTETAYLAVLRYIKDHIIPHNNIILAMSDFERGLRNAIVAIFPTAISTGCNVHYDRALYQKAKALGLQNTLRDDADAKSFFKKILALAYLPAHLIEAQYRRITMQLPANLRRRFSRFLLYYNRYWLNIVKPHGFTVYGLGRRTNNIIESYHSRLGHKMETHPAAWDFVCKLLKLQCNVRADVGRLRNNRQIGRHARYDTIFKQQQLVKAWRELHMRLITVDEFMQKAASLKGHVADIIVRESNGREGADFELHEPPVAVPLENDPDYQAPLFAEEPPLWLLDNADVAAPVAPAALADDVSDDETSGSSSDEPYDEEDIPNAIEEEIEHAEGVVPQVGALDGGRQTPPAELIAEEIEQDVVPEVWAFDGGRQTPPAELIAEEIEQDVVPEVWAFDGGRQTPPAELIAEEIEQDVVPEVWAFDGGRQTPPAELIAEEIEHPQREPEIGPHDDGRQTPPVHDIARRSRRPRRKRRVADHVTAPAETTSAKNKSRNKRRKEMRQKAKVRLAQELQAAQSLQDQVQAEAARLQAQLAEAQAELRRQAEARAEQERRRQLEADDALCRVCLLEPATHTFLPCGHRYICATCAVRIWDVPPDQRRCPFCRALATQPPHRIWMHSEH